MRIHLIVAVLVLAAVSSGPATAQQTTGEGTLGGQVLGTDGRAVGGARVTLQPSDGRAPKTVETNSQGRFWFPSLVTGLYDVRAYSKGHESEWRRNVWVERGKQSNVTLRLRSKKTPSGKNLAPATKP